jgi:hypothetical protein
VGWVGSPRRCFCGEGGADQRSIGGLVWFVDGGGAARFIWRPARIGGAAGSLALSIASRYALPRVGFQFQ